MVNAFNNGLGRHDFLQGNIPFDTSQGDTYFASVPAPRDYNTDRTKAAAVNDIVSLNIVLNSGAGLSDKGLFGTVNTMYRPVGDLFLSIRKDAAPYTEVGLFKISANGEAKTYFYSGVPSYGIFINGHYPVKAHA